MKHETVVRLGLIQSVVFPCNIYISYLFGTSGSGDMFGYRVVGLSLKQVSAAKEVSSLYKGHYQKWKLPWQDKVDKRGLF